VVMLGVTTQALPRLNEVSRPAAKIQRRFERQMEAVLAKEEYPLHRKELIRRYFLSLSQGEANPRTGSNSVAPNQTNQNDPGSQQ